MNAGTAIVAGGKVDGLAEGIAVAAESIDSGRALGKFEELKRVSNA